MTDEWELLARRDQLIADEYAASKGAMTWFYLSYAGDEGFRGGCYIRAFGPTCAAVSAKIEHISPGGEVLIVAIPPEHEDRLPPPAMRNRLLSMAEMQAFEPMVNLEGEEP